MFNFLKKDYLIKKTAIINLKSGLAFRGIMWYTDHKYFVLRNVYALNDGEKLDGELVIERENVEFIQVI